MIMNMTSDNANYQLNKKELTIIINTWQTIKMTTVKFLIVAASPIEAALQTFKIFFYKKFPTLKTSN